MYSSSDAVEPRVAAVPLSSSRPCGGIGGEESFLRTVSIFGALGDRGLAEMADRLEPVALQGGQRLFAEGDPSDSLYLVKSGALGAYGLSDDGQPQLLGIISSGEVVGEMGLISNVPRNALVRALRDSELLRLPKNAFEHLLERYPRAMMQVLSVAVTRLSHERNTFSTPRTFAVLAQNESVDIREFARHLKQQLNRYGSCALIDAAAGKGRDSRWFTALEAQHRFVIYLGECGFSDWRAQCSRQADAFVLAANAWDPPGPWPEESAGGEERVRLRPRHLVLLQRNSICPGTAAKWLSMVPGAEHHHIRRPADVARLGRLLIGQGVGIVLSGGGARGFAHIGVVRALREAGKPIDAVGGTSIGAIVGAGVAADWSYEEMMERYRRTFVDGRPLKDYTLPLVSMIRGRRVSALLAKEFGELDIRDLPLPYFCVSTNLTHGQAVAHRDGPLWFWLRATCAIPGVLPPVFHRGDVFVDGAVINNLPVDIMRKRPMGEVIGVDIGTESVLEADTEEHELPAWWRVAYARVRGKQRRPGILDILLRSGMINASAFNAQQRAQSDLLLSPPVDDVPLLDWSAFDKAVEAGYRHAVKILEAS